MTLQDAFAGYARKCAARTVFRHVRPLLAYRVVNFANENTRAQSSLSLPRAEPRGADAQSFAPHFDLTQVSHGPAHKGFHA